MLDTVPKIYDEIYKPGDFVRWFACNKALCMILSYDITEKLVDHSVYHIYHLKSQSKHIAYTYELTLVYVE